MTFGFLSGSRNFCKLLWVSCEVLFLHGYAWIHWVPDVELFPNRIPIELSQTAVPTIVLPKDDRTDFVQEERLGLPYWTMILAICAFIDVSKYLDILTLDLFLPFLPGFQQILRQLDPNILEVWCILHFDLGASGYCVCCLSCAPWQSGYNVHDFCGRHLRC